VTALETSRALPRQPAHMPSTTRAARRLLINENVKCMYSVIIHTQSCVLTSSIVTWSCSAFALIPR